MSKWPCRCENYIADEATNQSRHFPNEDFDASFGRFITFCVELIHAREAGKQDEFITNWFGEEYPKNLKLEDVVGDSLGGKWAECDRDVYECEHCGRLWIEPASDRSTLVSYLPESERRGVLSSRKQETEERKP